MFSIALVTIGFLAVNDALVKGLAFASSNSNMYRMCRLFGESHKEVAIIGSSRAETNFAPSAIGDHVFNYGLSGSAQGETLIHLKALLRRESNQTIIVNLDPWGLGGLDSVRGDYRLVKSALLSEANRKKPVRWDDRMPGFRFYGKLRTVLADWLNARRGGTKTIDHGAILQRLSRTKDEWAHMIERCKPMRFCCNESVRIEYEHVLQGEHPPVIFVVSPISKPWYERWEDQGKLSELLTRLASFPNTTVIDMCTPNIDSYDLAEFMDLTHLNEKGARRFSREMKDRL